MHRGVPRCRQCRDGRRRSRYLSDAALFRYLRGYVDGVGLADLARALDSEPTTLGTRLLAMHEAGLDVGEVGGKWTTKARPTTTFHEDTPLVSDKDGWHKFGAIGDTHLCSKQERLAELADMYRIFTANGVKTVLHTGNYIDGESRFNRHELKVHGMDAQLQYLGDHYPEGPGITTYMVSEIGRAHV